jgi:hypothetical protein
MATINHPVLRVHGDTDRITPHACQIPL